MERHTTLEVMLDMLGVPVVEVRLLHSDACWEPRERVGLLRPDLSPEVREACLDYLFQRACEQP